MSVPQPTDPAVDASRTERDLVLARIIRHGELAWLVQEQYDIKGPTWHVSLVRQGPQGVWMRQRYTYDIPSRVLFFIGERPASEAELIDARRTGRPVR